MSDGFPERMKVQTTTLKSGIAYGIASLGAVPLRYGQPRFPALRRRFQNDTQQKRLLKAVDGDPSNLVPPDIFALASFTTVAKQSSVQQGNQGALRHGVNFKGSNGQLLRLSGSYVEVAANATIYSNSMDLLLDWVDSVTAHHVIRGMSEFKDGGGVPINVEITPNFAWTDPVEPAEGINWIDRLFGVNVDFTIRTIAAHIASEPLFKGYVINSQVDGVGEEVVELPAVDPEDWQ